MIYLFYILTFIICLFILFEFAKNDFVLLRRNISLIQMFDYTFITALVGFLSARLFFIVDTHNFLYLSPINFLHVFKLPGLSVLGFFLGSALMLFILLKNRKVLQRVYDIFLISFFPLFLLSLFFMPVSRVYFYIPIIIGIVSFISFVLLILSIRNYTLKDGSVALIIMSLVSFTHILLPYFSQRVALIQGLSSIQLLSIGILIVSVVYLCIHQKIFSLFKK